MKSKLTLITSPDFFENGNQSILFVGLTDQEQETLSKWFAEKDLSKNLNLYVSDQEENTSWFLYALARCEYKYINLDNLNYLTQTLTGYMLAKNEVFYSVENKQIAEVVSHINQNKVTNVIAFMESILSV